MNLSDDDRNTYLVSQDKLGEGLAIFRNYLSGEDAQEILTIISDATKVIKGVKLVIDLKNWHIAKKIKKFVEGIESQEVSREEFRKLVDKYGQDKTFSNVLLSLESMRSEKQASAFAYLFVALIRGDLGWERFDELQNILERMDPSALDGDFNGSKEPSHKLVAVGLAYPLTVMDGGVKVLPNGKLYDDFEKYIVTPYREQSLQIKKQKATPEGL